MSRGRRTHDHEIIKNHDFDREFFVVLKLSYFTLTPLHGLPCESKCFLHLAVSP